LPTHQPSHLNQHSSHHFAGGIPTLANPGQTPKDFQAQLCDSTASIIIVHPVALATALEVAKTCKFSLSRIFLFGGKEIDGIRPYTDLLGDREAEPVVFTEKELKEQPACLCYSSGTTGRQKGVMTTHYNEVANCNSTSLLRNQDWIRIPFFMGLLVSLV